MPKGAELNLTNPAAEPAKGSVTTDPELRALIVIQRALGKLDAASRRRVLDYLRDRFATVVLADLAPDDA